MVCCLRFVFRLIFFFASGLSVESSDTIPIVRDKNNKPLLLNTTLNHFITSSVHFNAIISVNSLQSVTVIAQLQHLLIQNSTSEKSNNVELLFRRSLEITPLYINIPSRFVHYHYFLKKYNIFRHYPVIVCITI